MKAITFQGIERLAYEDVPDPGMVADTDAATARGQASRHRIQ